MLEGNDHKLRYLSVIDTLTINDESRLKRQNEILKVKKSEFEYLKQQVEETKRAQAKFTTDYMAFLKSKLGIPQDVNKIELTFDPCKLNVMIMTRKKKKTELTGAETKSES